MRCCRLPKIRDHSGDEEWRCRDLPYESTEYTDRRCRPARQQKTERRAKFLKACLPLFPIRFQALEWPHGFPMWQTGSIQSHMHLRRTTINYLAPGDTLLSLPDPIRLLYNH